MGVGRGVMCVGGRGVGNAGEWYYRTFSGTISQ